MANDNRKLPHRHDPELARKEALQARHIVPVRKKAAIAKPLRG